LGLLLLLSTVVLAGCDSDGNGDFVFTGTQGGGGGNPQSFRVQFFNVDEPGATTFLVQALDEDGNVVFGPTFIGAGSQFGVELPNGAREIQVGVRDENGTICVYQQRFSGETDVNINDPQCLEVSDFVTGIMLNPEDSTIAAGSTQPYTLTATLVNGQTVDITGLVPLSSSSTSIATVDASGIATGVAAGDTTISANVFYFADSSTLEVTGATGFALEADETTIFEGNTTQVNAIRTVDGAPSTVNDDVTWDSSDDSIATVNDSGLVTGVSFGTATISAADAVTGMNSSVTIMVLPEGPAFVRIPLDFEDISQTGNPLTIGVDATATVAVVPESPQTGDIFPGSNTDDGAVFVSFPADFDFSLLGDEVHGLWMSTNGFLSTGANDTDVIEFAPIAIPNTQFVTEGDPEEGLGSQPHNLIAPLFTDLVLDAQDTEGPPSEQIADDELGTMCYQVMGTAPNRRIIFQWQVRPIDTVFVETPAQVLAQLADDRIYTFQAKLFEGTNRMEFHYQDVTAEGIDANDASLGTLIGVENEAGTRALTWLFSGSPSANKIEDGDALRYYP
jgi:hypothetical protein